MADDDDLRLNTLNRFSKRSPRLTLEERGSCEVPAGCGGVVLRWVDPDRGRDLVYLSAFSGTIEAFVDGERVETGRRLAAYGEHTLAIKLGAPERRPIFMFVVAVDAPGVREEPARALLVTVPGGGWRETASDPGEGWERPGFADGSWGEPSPTAIVGERRTDSDRWRFDQLARWGAGAFAVDAPRWLRARFRLVRS
jgi:hypothetical protein